MFWLNRMIEDEFMIFTFCFSFFALQHALIISAFEHALGNIKYGLFMKRDILSH